MRNRPFRIALAQADFTVGDIDRIRAATGNPDIQTARAGLQALPRDFCSGFVRYSTSNCETTFAEQRLGMMLDDAADGRGVEVKAITEYQGQAQSLIHI